MYSSYDRFNEYFSKLIIHVIIPSPMLPVIIRDALHYTIIPGHVPETERTNLISPMPLIAINQLINPAKPV